MSVFIIKMRLDDSMFAYRETYYVFATTTIQALKKAYRAFERDTQHCDPGTLSVQSLERVDATVVK